MTTIIAFVSQKGGVGKSTLARGLAREAVHGGMKVKIADLDTQQGTCVDWHRTRLHAGIQPAVAVESFATAAEALKIADQYDVLIIDGPARTSKGTLAIARMAHLVVQPTGASVDDLRPAVREFHALVKAGIPKEKSHLRSITSGHRRKKPKRAPISRKPVIPCWTGACSNVRPIAKPRTPGMP
jgi:chromosome partitioning protein